MGCHHYCKNQRDMHVINLCKNKMNTSAPSTIFFSWCIMCRILKKLKLALFHQVWKII